MTPGPLQDVESLWRRLVLGFGTVVLVVLVATLLGGTVWVGRTVAAEEERLASTLGHVLSRALQRVSFSGRYRAQLLADEFVDEQSDLLYVVIERDGELFVQSGAVPDPLPPVSSHDHALRRTTVDGAPVLEVQCPFLEDRGDAVIGVVRIGISGQRAADAVQSGVLAVLAFALLAGSAAMVLVVRVSRRMARPVQALATEFSGILAHTPQIVWIEGRDGRIVRRSASFEALLPEQRGAPTRVVGQRFLDLVPEAADAAFLAQDAELWAGSPVVPRSEWAPVLRDEQRQLLCTRFGLASEPGEPVEFLCTLVIDVTEQHELQESLIQSRRMESIGQFAGGVAHDFNNMLTGMAGLTDLIEMEESSPAERAEYCGDLRRLNARAAELTARLLAFGRKQVTVVAPQDLCELLEDLRGFLNRVLREDVKLEITLPEHPLPVSVDRGQIDQVVMNLVSNARDAMEEGGVVRVEAESVELTAPRMVGKDPLAAGRYARIRVNDTGAGIDAAVADRLFDPFATTKGLGEGTGLGLSIVYSIVTRHGGAVEFESSDQGTTFSVYLPEIPSDELVEHPAKARSSLAEQEHLRILVVEDNTFVRTSIVAALRRMGHEVWDAADGDVGLALFLEEPGRYDVVLLDVVMPGLNGAEVCAAISEARPDVHVLFMTGYDDDILSDVPHAPDRVGWVGKPFTVEQLMVTIRELLA